MKSTRSKRRSRCTSSYTCICRNSICCVSPYTPRRPLRLPQIVQIAVDRQYLGAAACKFETVKTGVAADVEHAPAVQRGRQRRTQLPPLEAREIAELVIGRGLGTVRQMEIVK